MMKSIQKEKNRHHRKLLILFSIILFILDSTLIDLQSQTVSETLWLKGKGNYNGYRIPSLIVTQNGTLLAFCEGREGGDAGDIDLLIRRSKNNGKDWSKQELVWDDEANTCGNPCPVVDQQSGRIWLFMTWNLGSDNESRIIRKESNDTRRPFLCYSDDDGKTWSIPVNMSATCKVPEWGWYATGPGIGIQMTSPKYKNRLVIPANHSYDDPEGNIRGGPYGYGAHVLMSENAGKSWEMSDPIRPGCNESQIVELSDGSLQMNMRSYNNLHSRAISTSTDGGKTWSKINHHPQLVESRCQASLFKYGEFQNELLFLFSNPAVLFDRTHMTVKASFDNCQSWSNSKLIYSGPSAYSCLAKLPDGKIGLLYECGDQNPYEKIVFTTFSPQTLFSPGIMQNK